MDKDTSWAGFLTIEKPVGLGWISSLRVVPLAGVHYQGTASLAGLGGPELGQGEGEGGPLGGQAGALPQHPPALPAQGGGELVVGHSLEGLCCGLVVVEEALQGRRHGLGSQHD